MSGIMITFMIYGLFAFFCGYMLACRQYKKLIVNEINRTIKEIESMIEDKKS